MSRPRKYADVAARMRAYRARQKRASKTAKQHKQNWGTPWTLFNALHKEFGFTLDVCAEAENHKLDNYFTKEQDAFTQEWTGVCWMNPPYDRSVSRFMRKAWESAQAGATVVCLVKVDTSTKWWWEYCSRAAEIRFIVGRLKFVDTGEPVKRDDPAPFATAIIVFKPNFDGEGKVSYIDTIVIVRFGVTVVALRFRIEEEPHSSG